MSTGGGGYKFGMQGLEEGKVGSNSGCRLNIQP